MRLWYERVLLLFFFWCRGVFRAASSECVLLPPLIRDILLTADRLVVKEALFVRFGANGVSTFLFFMETFFMWLRANACVYPPLIRDVCKEALFS